jgi:hypothetical protein
VELRKSRPAPPNIERLREALTLRTVEWKENLKAEPHIARIVLRRLIWPYRAPQPKPRIDGMDGVGKHP